mmetsp:Transcript_60187/g.68555  ORF Transcript_60187/g.68555 Transcript_60187/m.68555 type:complete len:119 (-) Transcript_60187:147-503(-)
MENEERSIRYKISQKYREENFSLKMKRRMKLSRLGEADNKRGNSSAYYCINRRLLKKKFSLFYQGNKKRGGKQTCRFINIHTNTQGENCSHQGKEGRKNQQATQHTELNSSTFLSSAT